eukprot:831980-Pleurochrysis_carterae.AAC.1
MQPPCTARARYLSTAPAPRTRRTSERCATPARTRTSLPSYSAQSPSPSPPRLYACLGPALYA